MATSKQPENHWQTPRRIWRDEQFVYQVLGGLVLVGLGVWIGARLFGGASGYATNLYTKVLSISVTVFVLDLLARRREARCEEALLKADLIRRMGSKVRSTARSAADELRARGWLRDGSLTGAILNLTNLEGADLHAANLQGADLEWANLQEVDLEAANLRGAKPERASFEGANLIGANFEGASLNGANLKSTRLWRANLQEAELWRANFEGAILWNANLQGASLGRANLQGADLEGANLQDVQFDEYTMLPDGTRWTLDTDMTRFTDPAHPDFWRPEPDSVWWYSAWEGQDGDE